MPHLATVTITGSLVAINTAVRRALRNADCIGCEFRPDQHETQRTDFVHVNVVFHDSVDLDAVERRCASPARIEELVTQLVNTAVVDHFTKRTNRKRSPSAKYMTPGHYARFRKFEKVVAIIWPLSLREPYMFFDRFDDERAVN